MHAGNEGNGQAGNSTNGLEKVADILNVLSRQRYTSNI